MHRVEKGDFSQRLEVTGFNGEIDELIESYNKMAQELGGIEMFRKILSTASPTSSKRLSFLSKVLRNS